MTGHRVLASNHDFRVLWIGQTINELGSRMSLFVFPLLAWALTHSALIAAAVEAVFLLGEAGVLLPAGVLADRLDRRMLMRLASGSGMLLYASLAVAGLLGQLTIPHLVMVALLTGVAAGVHSPAETSAVRTVVPNEDLSTALSQLQARQHVAALIGAPIGGALYAVARWVPFVGDALSYAVAWLLLGRIRSDLSPVAYDGPPTRARDEIREGLGFIVRQPFFRTLLVWAALANVAVNALFFVALLRLVKSGFHPAEIGIVETAAGTAGLLGAIAAPLIIDRFATGRLTVLIAWSFVPLVVPMVLWNRPAVVAGCLAVGLLLNPAGNAGIGAYRVALTPARLQGRVGSASRFLATATMPLAPVIGGGLMAAFGGPTAVAALGGLTAVAALVVTLSRTVRSVPRPAVWQAELRGRCAEQEGAPPLATAGAAAR